MDGKKVLSSSIVTILLLGLLLTQIDFGDIFKVISSAPPSGIILGFTLYVFSYLFRALRFKMLLEGDISITDLFPIVCVHSMMNNILPLRAGELSYIYLIRKRKFLMRQGIATLMVARILDFIVISLLFLISMTYIKKTSEIISSILVIVCILLVLMVLFLFFLISWRGRFIRLNEIIVDKLRLNNFRITRFLLRGLKDVIESLRGIRSKNIFVRSFFISVLLWMCLYLADYALVNALGLELDILTVMFVATFCYITSILPVHGIAGFGTVEGSLSIGFIIVGISRDIAISSSFALHIIAFSFFLSLGVLGMLAMRLRENY